MSDDLSCLDSQRVILVIEDDIARGSLEFELRNRGIQFLVRSDLVAASSDSDPSINRGRCVYWIDRPFSNSSLLLALIIFRSADQRSQVVCAGAASDRLSARVSGILGVTLLGSAGSVPELVNAFERATCKAPECRLTNFPRLTLREGEVLREILSGKSIDQIARKLWISPSTARAHTSSILRKHGVGSRLELLSLETILTAREVPNSSAK